VSLDVPGKDHILVRC